MEVIKYAVVGTGRGKVFMSPPDHTGLKLTAVCDLNPDKLTIVKYRYDKDDSVELFTDYDEMLAAGEKFDMIITIGPLIMMKFVVAATRPPGIPCVGSMNPIMIDGTGMCGGCRLTLKVDGKAVTKFACVDGPDFNGYEVDFDEAISRGRMYQDFERHAYENSCNLFKKEVK